jgi:peptidoglycan/LPS O-acetylase OafA/YrhL
MSWAATHKDLPLSTHIFMAFCIFVLAIAIAYGSLKLYDEPVREWLKKRWFKK